MKRREVRRDGEQNERREPQDDRHRPRSHQGPLASRDFPFGGASEDRTQGKSDEERERNRHVQEG
jgi:hypothetical protein